ncbi:MAG: aminotransferase class V-fold PLP-dependent enzyme [Planctomycetota bacterium]|nr:aminotransferase class V-fold PLP-dependent enzyme [Planctomycetota bacterium]
MTQTVEWNQAATSSHLHPGVPEAVLEGLHAPSAHRGQQGSGTYARLHQIRATAGRLFGSAVPERVIFTPGCTWGLNLAILGAVQPGHRVLTSALEHNAVARPLEAARRRGTQVEVLDFDATGRLRLEEWETRLRAGADWVVLSIASNLLGTIQAWEEICRLARQHGARVILDLAQGGGLIPVDLDAHGCSYAAVSGHKGLHGPRGVGLLFVAQDENPEPWIRGGTGTEGALLEMPESWPQRLEPGTSNLPGIFGLGAALDWAEAHPPNLTPVRARLAALEAWCRARTDLKVMPPEPLDWKHRLSVLAIRPTRIPSELLSTALGARGIDQRSGSLCTSRVLPALGLSGGVVRLSPPLDADDAEFAAVQGVLAESLDALA